MSQSIGPSFPPPFPLASSHPKSAVPETPVSQQRSRTDSLSLSSMAASMASSALEWLRLLKHIVDGHGGGLRGANGESLTPEQALQRLSDGDEVIAKVHPSSHGARSISALLLSLDDLPSLQAKIA